MWPVIFHVLKWLEKRIFFCIFASKQIKSMRATFLNIKLLILAIIQYTHQQHMLFKQIIS